jgi:hypothetical protein
MVNIIYAHPLCEWICTAATRRLVINVYCASGSLHTAAQLINHAIVSPVAMSFDDNFAISIHRFCLAFLNTSISASVSTWTLWCFCRDVLEWYFSYPKIRVVWDVTLYDWVNISVMNLQRRRCGNVKFGVFFIRYETVITVARTIFIERLGW